MNGFVALKMITGLAVRRARRGRMFWITVVVLALTVASALITLLSGYGGISSFNSTLEIFLRYLTPFILALHTAHAVSEEVQQKTITYLFSRPMPRWALPLGKYLGSLCLTLPLLCTALVLVYVIGLLGHPAEITAELPRLVWGLVAVCAGALLFGAAATAIGTMVTGHPFVVTMIYLLVAEVGLSAIPGWTKLAAMTVHLRAVAGIYQAQRTLTITDPELSAAISLPVVLALTAVWIVLAVGWVGASEYKTES